MAKINKSLEAKLDALRAHQFGKDAKEDETVLVAGLRETQHRVVARAAELAAERLCYGATAALKEAYRRFLDDPVKKDPQCIAKQAIVRALVTLDCPDAQFYVEGLSYRQMEPGWGKPTDSAVDIRNSCAMGLVNSGYPRALQELTVLLNDSEARARIGAVHAIACGNPSEAELLLRFKTLVGDAEPEVLGECFGGLLAVAGTDAVALIVRQLAHDSGEVRECAALALGESQLPEALAGIRQAFEEVFVSPDYKRVLTRAAALHRSDAAFDWLISLIAEGSTSAAEAALEALSIYRNNDKLTARIKTTLATRGTARLDDFFAQRWV